MTNATQTPQTMRLYQVGGLALEELEKLVAAARASGAEIELVSEDAGKRFAMKADEFAVLSDDIGVMSLFTDHRVNVGRVAWSGSMATPDLDTAERSSALYPDRLPLTDMQIERLRKDDATLYRVGGLSREMLDDVVSRINGEGTSIEVVKVAGNRFDGSAPEFTVKTSDEGAIGLLSQITGANVGVC